VFAEPVAERGHSLVEWMPAAESLPPEKFDAAIVLGGGMHPHQEEEHPWLRAEKSVLADLLRARLPTLGVCLGAELLAEVAGAPPVRMEEPDVGWRSIDLTPAGREDPVLGGLPERFTAFEWHSFATPLPAGGTTLARGGGRIEAFRLERAWAIQFHAEVTREIVNGWLDRYRDDPDLLRAGLDPTPLLEETDTRIGPSNELGAELCGRFVDHAEALAARPGPTTRTSVSPRRDLND
jgi:GMP synthase-like glutamine amidotransferase